MLAGRLDQTMLRSCFRADTTTMALTQGGSVLQKEKKKTLTREVLLFTVVSLPTVLNSTPLARRPAPAAARGHGERVTCLGAICHSPSTGRG